MAIEFRLDGTLLTNRISIPDDIGGFVSAAERGAIGRGGIVIEDPDGSLDFRSWRTFTVDDTDATPTRVWTGHIIDRDVSRGNQPTAGVARIHDCRLEDQNGLLHLVLNRILDNDAKRPAETDSVRVPWLLTSRALAGIVFDRGLVSLSNPGSFLASDCRRRHADDVLAEMAPSTVKNFYVMRDEATGDPALVWQRDQDAYWAATIAISNDAADEDGDTVFFPLVDAEVQRGDPADGPYTGVDYGWNGPGFFVESADTIAAYGMRRELPYTTDRVGIAATAQAQAAAWLNVHAGETDFIPVSVIVPATHVNKAYAGQEINVKLVHVPGFEDFVTTRIRRRMAVPVVSGHWRLDLELWVPSVPATDAAPVECIPVATHARLMRPNDNDWSGGGDIDIQLFWGADGDNPQGGDAPDPKTGLVDYYPIGSKPTEGWHALEIQGNGTLDTIRLAADGSFVCDGDITVTGAIQVNGVTVGSDVYASSGGLRFDGPNMDFTITDIPVVAGDIVSARFIGTGNIIGGITVPAGTGSGSHMLLIDGPLCADVPTTPLPVMGTVIEGEVAGGTVDNSNNVFTTAHPYLAGWLRVFHDGIDETASIASQDPAAGTFTLNYSPGFGSTITVRYKAA